MQNFILNKEIEYKFLTFLVSILPITIIIGQAISLINITLISIIITIEIVKSKKFYFLKNISFILFVVIFLYLLFNTLISLDKSMSFLRNFGFMRFIFLFVAINYFFYFCKNQNLLFKIWVIVILVVIIDSFIEYIFGKNILGFGAVYGSRIVSFFKDEPIVAGYLNGFFFLILGYLFNNKNSKNSRIFLACIILSFIFLICVSLTGERSNTFKSIIGLSIFFFLNNKLKIKYRIITLLCMITVAVTAISNSDYLKYRYYNLIIYPIINEDKREKFINNNIYIKHYKSGYAVYKNYPLFGVGNKNYRIETNNNRFTKKNYFPDTHPHQVYLEFLSEHGLIGTLLFLSIVFFLIFRNLKSCIISENCLQLGAFSFLIINFLPILPSGAFFSDFNITLFFINFSIFLACNPSSNIFSKKNVDR